MSSPATDRFKARASARPSPPDQSQRIRALDPSHSILVQAPAGSGKTDLLTRRFLRLLAEVDSPSQIVAITFTRAAAAEMRHRILAELEKAAAENADSLPVAGSLPASDREPSESLRQGTTLVVPNTEQKGARALAPEENVGAVQAGGEGNSDESSLTALAAAALARSRALGWNLTDLPSQLRISTIDAFCRELALQQPLVSGLGGSLDPEENPADLYRRAARRTLEQIDTAAPPLRDAPESLLLWRDNNWSEVENLLVEMLSTRDRWMHDFLLAHDPDWDQLRARLERPFAHSVHTHLAALSRLLDQLPHARQQALDLARFACTQTGGALHRDLAELTEFPTVPFTTPEALEEARQACECLADLLLTKEGALRSKVDKRHGFPADRKPEKARLLQLIADLAAIPAFEPTLAGVRNLPPARYTDEDWQIVRACFTLLRHAAGELKVVFAESGSVDFTEVAQVALNVLRSEDNLPSDAAIALADGIHHLLVDEFQDTSRRQHRLLAHLIAAWPDRTDRTVFVVGDPMQSIYFFRDADAELFARIRDYGLELPTAEPPLLFDHVPLTANFRTTPALVTHLNRDFFPPIFAVDDGSGIAFEPAIPAREADSYLGSTFNLHLNFISQPIRNKPDKNDVLWAARKAAQDVQLDEIVSLVRTHLNSVEPARLCGEKYRIAVLARTRAALAPIAQALRDAKIPFRAVDLEDLRDRPEVRDALSLARALLNPQDRVSWLGVLRAPWCGLSLADSHTLTSADDPALLARPIPELLAERVHLLSPEGRAAVTRVRTATAAAPALRAAQPTASLGTWLEQVWLRLGGEDCVDAAARANLTLLWSRLDRLPNGEQDLLGPALEAALADLKAEPDPAASTEHGVQLMTIHKSKGLEFEVVIVPGLQAPAGRPGFKMLSWLERGLAETGDDPGEITEFLIAPFQPKGAERGSAKVFVDRSIRDRELQEARRILYVAATRAREELHFFALPSYKTEAHGSVTLAEPRKGSLLATAWPALEAEVRAGFAEWKSRAGNSLMLTEPSAAEPAVLESLAASAADNLLTMPPPAEPATSAPPTPLRRLPAGYHPAPTTMLTPAAPPIAGLGATPFYSRHEGGLHSRALGSAVHALLEELARLRIDRDWPSTFAALAQHQSRITAQIRSAGLAPAHAASIAAEALRLALAAAEDPAGAWILSPHAEAASEVRWTGLIAGALHSIRVDRVFQAGPAPGTEGNQYWWLIDYKTAHADVANSAAALPELRRLFAPQLEAYAALLRNLHHPGSPIRAGLYYPRMAQFDWWELE